MGPLLISVLVITAVTTLLRLASARATSARLLADARPLEDRGIAAMAARIASALDLPHLVVRVHDAPMVNGFAAPDGNIYLTRGFIDHYRAGRVTDAELASVIAHELGHVALGHTRRRMIDFTGQSALVILIGTILGRFIPFVGFWIADFLLGLFAARLSRRDEYEADEYAAAVLTRAGIGTGPQKSLFRKLGHLSGNIGAEIPDWLRSHPRVEDRISAIEALETRWHQQA